MNILKYLAIPIIAVSLLLPWHTSAASTPDKYAIVCGYSDKWHNGADGDARMMAGILKRAGFKAKNIVTLINNKYTHESFKEALVWAYNTATYEDEFVYFYAGEVLYMGSQLIDAYLPVTRKSAVIIMQCSSGRFIPNYEKEGRVVITSATATSPSVDGQPLTVWGELFLNRGLKQGLSLEQAYEQCGLGLMSDNYEGEFYL